MLIRTILNTPYQPVKFQGNGLNSYQISCLQGYNAEIFKGPYLVKKKKRLRGTFL